MGWTVWHDRLHRRLLRQPHWLPQGGRLLLALSGGQDSMALLALLRDLQPLHRWQLHLWHGDHGWHAGSSRIAAELQAWCRAEGLDLAVTRASVEHASNGQTPSPEHSEAGARAWRYGALAAEAERLSTLYPHSPCRVVITAHTASDRAETLLLQLARGTDLAGLGGQRSRRPLESDGDLPLVRPLVDFSRKDSATICQELALPVWQDPSNNDPSHGRNRIRAEVLPVLESLHPGCTERLADLANRMAGLQDSQSDLMDLALIGLVGLDADPAPQASRRLPRRPLAAQPEPLRRNLLAHWLRRNGAPTVTAACLADMAQAMRPGAAAASRDLPAGWRIHWNARSVQLEQRNGSP
jgi:tRNA(Ile)-lysidine synthase